MARGCSGSDSEEERHDRFRSERNNTSLNASKSLFGTGLRSTNKARSPLRRVNSPSRRDRRSPSKRSRSRSKRSKERKRSKEIRVSKEKSKKESEKNNRRSKSKSKEPRYSDGTDSGRSESKRRSRSKGRRRSGSKEKKRKREIRKSDPTNVDQTSDTFLQRFERRRPSVENEIVENTVIYRDSSPEGEPQLSSRTTHENKARKKEKKTKNHGDTEEGELISEEENNCFGPALPPRLESEEEDGEVKDNILVVEGPALPPGFSSRESIVSALPERLSTRKRSTSQEECLNQFQSCSTSGSDEERKEGHRLPLIGPSLPPRENLPSVEDQDDNEEALYGPALPPQPATSVGEEEEDALIGPLPKGMEKDDRVQRILEERAQSLRIQMENKGTGGESGSELKGRDEWMLELPEVKAAHLGLGPRKFRTREGPDMSDRSSWTDTPGSKQNKQEEQQQNKTDAEDSKRLDVLARNEEMERRAKETSKHRDKSLLDMHQKDLKKKKKKALESSGGKEERRPFSREIDLQSNRLDEARTRSVINKAQLLNTRFASGESKYL